MAAAAQLWWRSVVSEPHSFEKASLFVGMGKGSVSNIMPMYAHERTSGNITLVERGALGFVSPDDRMCWKVKVRSCGNNLTKRIIVPCQGMTCYNTV
jgi:hypothetical protein